MDDERIEGKPPDMEYTGFKAEEALKEGWPQGASKSRQTLGWQVSEIYAIVKRWDDEGKVSRAAAMEQHIRRRSEEDWQVMIEQVNDLTRQRDELQARIETLEAQNVRLMGDNTEYRQRIQELLKELSATHPITNEPLLGLADTESLMRELITRFQMNMYGEHTKMLDFERALVLAEMLGTMGATEREYRPVDNG